MWDDVPLFPESASTMSDQVDYLFFFLVAVSAFFVVLIASLIVIFSIRYRRREGVSAAVIHGSNKLELFWTFIPLMITLVMFYWGARIFFDSLEPPRNAMDVYVTGKQWMWKVQHPQGQREINDLHVPVNTPVRLTMTSEDVIHSFYVPAFRMKRDVLPGRYTIAWFEANKPGEYHLFCAEYCGTKHSQMIGTVYVMEQHEYERWLSGASAGDTPAVAGQKLFEGLRCDTCHSNAPDSRGPDLASAFGSSIALDDGRRVLFDEDYARESLLNPGGKLVAGFKNVMPTYDGQLSEDQIMQLIAHIKSLAPDPAETTPAGSDEGEE